MNLFTATFLVLTCFFLVFASLIALCIAVGVLAGGGDAANASFFFSDTVFVFDELVIHILVAGRNLVDALFGGIFGHLGELSIIVFVGKLVDVL